MITITYNQFIVNHYVTIVPLILYNNQRLYYPCHKVRYFKNHLILYEYGGS